MTSVGIRELKQNASQVINEVAKGTVTTVTDRGRPVAQIIPLQQTKIQQLLANGLATPAKQGFTVLPELIILDHESASDTLSAMRDDERY